MVALKEVQTAFLEEVSNDTAEALRLVEVHMHKFRNGNEERKIKRYSKRPFQSGPNDTPPVEDWLGLLRGDTQLSRSVADALLNRGESVIGAATSGNVEIFNDDEEQDEDFGPDGFSTEGQPIEEYITGSSGKLNYKDKIHVASAVGGRAQATDLGISISTQSAVKFLDRLMVTHTLETSEFPNLSSETVGRVAPEAWGTVFNIEPILVDPINLQYYICRYGYRVLQVRVGGLPLVEGTDYSVIDTGGAFLLKLVNNPDSGKSLKVDIQGAKMLNNIYSETLRDILEDIIMRGAPQAVIRQAGLAQLAAARPYNMGIYIKNKTPIREVLLRLLRGMLSFVIEDRFGELNVGALEKPTGVTELTVNDDAAFTRRDAFSNTNLLPIQIPEIRYAQLETREDEGTLSALYQDSNSVYSQNLEYYKRGYKIPSQEDLSQLVTSEEFVTFGPYNTRITNLNHAIDHRTKMLELRGDTSSFVTVEVDQIGLQLCIMDEMFLMRDRMNLKKGKAYRILGAEDRRSTVELELWG